MPSQKPMRLLLIGPFPDPIHGCSIANQTLFDGLKKHSGASVSNINTNVDDTVSAKQGSVFSLKKAISFLGVYLNVGKVWRADVVYITPGHTFYGFLKYAPFILLCLLFNTPYILHIHGNNLGKEFAGLSGFKQSLLRMLAKSASYGIVLSESLKGNFTGLLEHERVVAVPNFFNDELKEVALEQKQYDKLRLLYLSNLMKEKGILDVLQACKILKEKKIDFDLKIAGKETPEDRDDFRRLLAEVGDGADYLALVSGQKKIDAFANSNIFILPTYYQMEGQPISIIEAMATGNLIVTTRHSGIPDIVDEHNARFVPPDNFEELSNELVNLSSQMELVKNIGEYNQQYAYGQYAEDKFIENIYAFMKQAYNK